MNVLEYPPTEILHKFNYGSLGLGLPTIINNLWTWVAVLTAAVSFWRLRATSPAPAFPNPTASSLRPNNDQSSPSGSRSEIISQLQPSKSMPELPATSVSVSSDDMQAVGLEPEAGNDTYKGGQKTYRVYCDYQIEEEEEEWEHEDHEVVPDYLYSYTGNHGEYWTEKWKMVLKLSTGETGWHNYSCQDLTVINGNVVRFWDAHTCYNKPT